jgi:hypothetical protein
LTDTNYPADIAALAPTDLNRWREVTLLAAAKAVRGSKSSAWNLAEALCNDDVHARGINGDIEWRISCGTDLLESADLDQVSKWNQAKTETYQRLAVNDHAR